MAGHIVAAEPMNITPSNSKSGHDMATVIYARPLTPETEAKRFQDALDELRDAIDAVEGEAAASPRAARRHVYRLQTIAASTRELASSIGTSRAAYD